MRAAPDFLPAFLKAAEGVKLRAYQDSAGVFTIGCGHTGPEVHKGLVTNMAHVDIWLASDINAAIRKLYGALSEAAILRLDEHQWGAIISFAFNLGVKRSWTIWKLIEAGKLDQVPDQLMRFTQARNPKTGKPEVVPGLMHRRMAERQLWKTADLKAAESIAQAAPVQTPSSVTRLAETPPVAASSPMTGHLVTAGLSACAAVPVAVKQVQDVIQPFADASPVVAQGLTVLATVAAGAAVAGLGLAWLHSRQARH